LQFPSLQLAGLIDFFVFSGKWDRIDLPRGSFGGYVNDRCRTPSSTNGESMRAFMRWPMKAHDLGKPFGFDFDGFWLPVFDFPFYL
jgi:hypothetical protein